MNKLTNILGLVFFLLGITSSFSQTTLIGHVIDAKTKEPLSYVSIFVSSSVIEYSDDEGFFEFNIDNSTDSIVFNYLGYKNYTLKKKQLKKDTLEIKLEPEGYMLQEFVVKAKRRVKEKDTIAIRIFRNVVKHKSDNKPKSYDSYQYEEYMKLVTSLYNASDKLLNRKILKPFRLITQNQDTTENGVKIVPLIMMETISDIYKKSSPNKEKTILKASHISGIEQLRFSDLFASAYEDIDIYADQTIVGGKTFVLPFAGGALALYNFYFIDSVKTADSIWTYQLAFVPKSKSDLLFIGRAWIQDSSFAIKKIEISIDRRSNLNFVNDYMLKQSFTEVKNIGWFLEHEERATNIAFSKRKNARSFRLYRSISRENIQLNEPIPDTIFTEPKYYKEDGYRKKTDSFWVDNRHDTLSPAESKIYVLMDSLMNTKFMKRIMKFGEFLSSGYYRINKFQVGGLHQFFSLNDVEGYRFRMGFKSNWRLSEKIQFKTYLAYGTLDKKVKYGGNIDFRLPNKKQIYNIFGFSYKDDYQRFSLEPNALEYDHIINVLTRKKNIPDLIYVRQVQAYYKRQIFSDYNIGVNLTYKKFFTVPGKIEFNKTMPDSSVVSHQSFKIFSPQFIFSGTPGAKMLSTANRQVFLKGKLPRFTFTYTPSFKNLLSDFSFHRLELVIEERLPTPIGRTFLLLEASKLFGNAPYPLLVIHPGNQSWLSQYRRFNMMNESEFAADQQITFILEHHFDGFFFNKIPLWKKLGLREVFFTKMAVSSLDKNKIGFSDLPSNMKGLNGFYAEIGFGIESILKLFRVDFNWRLTQLDHANAKKFRVTFAFSPNL
ncbi:MAG TPA: DUF5686 family protein [Chitinophagales bacterium]|nr:DUF5686 family protein [Chitinophagales bacterium]